MLRSQVRVLAPDDGEQQLLVDAAGAGHHPRPRLPVRTVAAPLAAAGVYHNLGVKFRAATNPLVLTITAKAPTRAFSWLKVPTIAFTFKTLC